MIRFLMILALAVLVFAACPPHFSASDDAEGGTAQAATVFRSELARIAMASAAMRRSTLEAGREYPEPRPEVLFPTGR
jgi:hypothetical protein